MGGALRGFKGMHDAVALEELAARGRRRCLLIIGVFFALTELRVLGLLGGLHLFRYFEVRLHQLVTARQRRVLARANRSRVALALALAVCSEAKNAQACAIIVVAPKRDFAKCLASPHAAVTSGLLRSQGRVEV